VIRIKIKTAAILKDRLFVGEKGTYLNITLIETPNDKYGNDFVAVQDLGKEARERGEKGPILGNAKLYAPRGKTEAKTPAPSVPVHARQAENLDEDVPF
jgi:hypothetical protein